MPMTIDRLTSFLIRLRVWGLNGFAASLLEAAGPLALLGAQTLYAAGPMLTPLVPDDEVTTWARWLEDPHTLPQLAARLSQEADE